MAESPITGILECGTDKPDVGEIKVQTADGDGWVTLKDNYQDLRTWGILCILRERTWRVPRT